MMAEAIEPTVTRCAPGQRTPKDQVRLRDRPASPVSQANGLIEYARANGLSHQTMLSRSEQESEAEIKSVAMSNPDRRGRKDAIDGSALGQFVIAHYSDQGEQQRRFWAGSLYAHKLDNFQVASGLAAREWGKAPVVPGEITREEAEERKKAALAELEKVRDVIREVDISTVAIMDRLCYDADRFGYDYPIKGHHVGRAMNALYKLAVHFQLEKRDGYGRR